MNVGSRGQRSGLSQQRAPRAAAGQARRRPLSRHGWTGGVCPELHTAQAPARPLLRGLVVPRTAAANSQRASQLGRGGGASQPGGPRAAVADGAGQGAGACEEAPGSRAPPSAMAPSCCARGGRAHPHDPNAATESEVRRTPNRRPWVGHPARLPRPGQRCPGPRAPSTAPAGPQASSHFCSEPQTRRRGVPVVSSRDRAHRCSAAMVIWNPRGRG